MNLPKMRRTASDEEMRELAKMELPALEERKPPWKKNLPAC
jgi:protein subunit release factor A